jgi:glucuronoarabinoxylan endo-1,4-beta-xylanase
LNYVRAGGENKPILASQSSSIFAILILKLRLIDQVGFDEWPKTQHLCATTAREPCRFGFLNMVDALRADGWLRLATAALVMATVSAVGAPPSCVVDWNDVRQQIDGFGGGVVFLNPASLDPVAASNMDTLFLTNTTSQLGLTLLRTRIDSSTNWSNGLVDGQNAVARGARVLATPWSPPAGMKSTNSIVGGSLLASQYANYANYLNGFAGFMRTNGAPLAAISLQNEPDANVPYESCSWTPAQLQAFCHTNAGAITNAPVLMPESEGFNTAYSDPTLSDSVAATNVSIIAGHLYGVSTIQDYAYAHAKGKPTWMTEYLVNDQSIDAAIATAQQVHDCLTVGNMSAYIWWKCLGDANGLVNAAGVPQIRGFMMAQFSRFVRPGFHRIGATNTATDAVSAYKGVNGAFAIVAVNSNSTDVAQTFSFTNCAVTNIVTPWITSSNLSLALQAAASVTNSSFTYTVPAMSVVTFVGQISNGPPVINSISLAGGKVHLSVSGPTNYNYTLKTSTNLLNWQALLTTNLPIVPTTLVDPNLATNHARFYRLQLGP